MVSFSWPFHEIQPFHEIFGHIRKLSILRYGHDKDTSNLLRKGGTGVATFLLS